MPSERSYRAVVEKIVLDGQHGPYAVTKCSELGVSITISLDKSVWEEKDYPEPGTYVVLSRLMRKRAGWRANHGRFVTPSDERSHRQPRARSNEL